MADSNFRGPISNMGSLEVQAGTAANIEPLDGPMISYQDMVVPDIRSVPFAKDGTAPARVPSFASGLNLWGCDNIPQASATNVIATAAVATNAVAVALATVGIAGVASACSIAVGVPIIPVGTTVATTAALAIDFGFTTGTTIANSSTVTVIDNTLFKLGQWIIVGNVGNSAATKSLVTQIQSTSGTTTIFVSPVAATALSNVPIGQANLFGSSLLPLATQFGPAAASANAHSFGGAFEAGLARVMNPRETLSRNIIMALATSGTYSALVSGWDVWGNPMTEVISLSSQTTGAGKRAFKYIGSIVSGTSSTDPASFGLGDTFGFPFRSDEWDQVEVTWNKSSMTNANGYTSAFIGAATSTSGDVRGTVQISTTVVTGVLATAISAIASNGTSRLAFQQNVGVWNQMFGTPNNTVPMFGVAQFTGST